jgi:hypothetical protein
MKKMVPLVYAVNAVVVAAIAVGLMMSGSPADVRAYRMDQTRVDNLMNIQNGLNTYWSKKADLPSTLKEAEDPNAWFVVPNDPETDSEYEYKKISKTAYELCATFALPTRPVSPEYRSYYFPSEVFYDHGEGRVCFTRNVDESLRDPNVKPVQAL